MSGLGAGDAGPLQPLLDAPGVTDVLVNGPAAVWVDAGDGLRRVDVDLGGEEGLRALAVRLAASAGRRLDTSAPYVDARLPGGVRLHAVLPPVTPEGVCLSLRVLRPPGLGLDQLCGDPDVGEVLRAVIGARLAFVVTGGTGSGKTTLLSALLGVADPRERIVLVEDAGELRPGLPHVVRLETRLPNVEGTGGIDLRQLVRQALRMRPDRLVIGEVRGAEIADLLLALNTGHEGGATTLHANSCADVPARLEAVAALAGLGGSALHAQAAAALRVVVHVARDGRQRRVREVGVVLRPVADGPVQVVGALLAPTRPGGVVRAVAAAPRLAALLRERGVDPPAALLPLGSVRASEGVLAQGMAVSGLR